MNRKSLFGRLVDSTTATRAAERPDYYKVHVEPLEDRKMLAATTYWSDDWSVTAPASHVGLDPVDLDIVSSPDFGGVSGLEYSSDAFGLRTGGGSGSRPLIADAIPQTDNGGTLRIGEGTAIESDVVISHPMIVQGQGVGVTFLHPEVTSAATTGDFPTGTHSGIIIQMDSSNLAGQGVSITGLTIDGNGNAGIGGSLNYHHGITSLYSAPAGSTQHNGSLTASPWGAAGPNGTNETVPDINIDGVVVKNVFWHGITISANEDKAFDTGAGELKRLNIFNSTVDNVGPASKDQDRIGILMQNVNDNLDATLGNAVSNTISNVGTGVKMSHFGTLSGELGTQNGANNGAQAVLQTVTNAQVYGFWIRTAREEDNFLLHATAATSNVGTGIFLDHSRADGLSGTELSGFQTGIHVQHSSFGADITPFITQGTLTGPSSAAGSVGILVDNDAAYETIFLVDSGVVVSGYETGIKVAQVVAATNENLLSLDRPQVSGNTTDLVVGAHSHVVGNLGYNTFDDVSVTGTGILDPRATNNYNFGGDGPDFYNNSTAQPGSPTVAPDKADIQKAANITLSSTSKFTPVLTGETGTEVTQWNFNNAVTYPGLLAPPLNNVDSLIDPQSPYGALTSWSGDVTQGDGATLVLGGDATVGEGLGYFYGVNNHVLSAGPPTTWLIDTTDFTGRTYMNLSLKLGSTNVAPIFVFGLVDNRSNTESWVIPTTLLNSTTFTTIKIPLMAPSIELTENDGGANDDDVGINLAKIAGYVFGGDQGLSTGNQNTPLRFSIDNFSLSMLKNSQLEVTGTFDLAGASLAAELRSGFVPTTGDLFTIVNNTSGSGATSSRFSGLPNSGDTVNIGGTNFTINYAGGDGNDVVLEKVGFTSTVTGRKIFYNQSKYDGNSAGIVLPTVGANNDDGDAIDTSKSAYVPGAGSAITPASMVSYDKGVNGIFVEITGTHGTLSLSDFQFAVSGSRNLVNNTPSKWAAAPTPTHFTVISNTPSVGTDRVEFIWDTTSVGIKNKYLEVTTEGNDAGGGSNTNTGLTASDYFYFGSLIGDEFVGFTATSFVVNGSDELAARAATPAFSLPVTNVLDFDKNSALTANDQIVSRTNVGAATGGFIFRINIPGPPPPPPAGDGDSGVASALAAGDDSGGGSDSGWVASRLASAAVHAAPAASAIAALAVVDSPDALSGAGDGDDDLDSLLDSVLDDLGLG